MNPPGLGCSLRSVPGCPKKKCFIIISGARGFHTDSQFSHTCRCTHIHTHRHTHTHNTYHTYIQTHTHTFTCMHPHRHTDTRAQTPTHIHTDTCTHSTHTHTNACMYTQTPQSLTHLHGRGDIAAGHHTLAIR